MTAEQKYVLRLSTVGVDYYSLTERYQEVLTYLSRKLKYCAVQQLSDTVYHITERGRAALAALEDAAEKQAEDKAEKSSQRKISIINVAIPIITLVCGMVIDNLGDIIAFVKRLFD